MFYNCYIQLFWNLCDTPNIKIFGAFWCAWRVCRGCKMYMSVYVCMYLERTLHVWFVKCTHINHLYIQKKILVTKELILKCTHITHINHLLLYIQKKERRKSCIDYFNDNYLFANLTNHILFLHVFYKVKYRHIEQRFASSLCHWLLTQVHP